MKKRYVQVTLCLHGKVSVNEMARLFSSSDPLPIRLDRRRLTREQREDAKKLKTVELTLV